MSAFNQRVAQPRSYNDIFSRYHRSLNPLLRKGPWTAEEDVQLLRILQDLSIRSYSQIARLLGTRSDLSVRQHLKVSAVEGCLKSSGLWR